MTDEILTSITLTDINHYFDIFKAVSVFFLFIFSVYTYYLFNLLFIYLNNYLFYFLFYYFLYNIYNILFFWSYFL